VHAYRIEWSNAHPDLSLVRHPNGFKIGMGGRRVLGDFQGGMLSVIRLGIGKPVTVDSAFAIVASLDLNQAPHFLQRNRICQKWVFDGSTIKIALNDF